MKKIILGLVILLFANCSRFTNIQKSTNIAYKYKEALAYYNKKSYNKAATLLEELLPLMKGQAEAENALYTFAKAQYYQNQLIMSAYWFKRFYDTYPRSEFSEESYYMHCLSKFEDSPDFSLDQSTTIEARDAIQQFLEAFPKSKYITECNSMVDKINEKLETKSYNLAKQFYKMSDYRACAIAFDNLSKDYPSSKYLEEVMFLKIQSQYEFATQSIETKKKERIQTAIEYYYSFVDKYPNSSRLKAAEAVYDKIKEIETK